MNKVDTERLTELKVHVWSRVAKYLLEEKKEDPYQIFDSFIESHRGRVNRALTLLKKAEVISKTKGKDKNLYNILKFEESKKLSVKPTFTKNLVDTIIINVNNNSDDYKNLKRLGYKYLQNFTEAEILYIYWHLDEFNVITWKNENYIKKVYYLKVYYLKEQMTFNNKAILKSFVELELLSNFPQYIQAQVGYSDQLIRPEIELEFEFKKYAISSVFLNGELEAIFECYKEHNDNVNAMLDSFNKTKAWVANVGGYQEAIKLIRKGIIDDFSKNIKRFPMNSGKDVLYNQDYVAIFRFINDFPKLFNYETLYGDPELEGEKIFNITLENSYYNRDNSCDISPAELEEFKK